MIAMRLGRLNGAAFVIAIVIGLMGCVSGDEYKRFILGGFSPDGSRLALAYCTKRQICKFGYLELATRSFFELAPQSPDQAFAAAFGILTNGAEMMSLMLFMSDVYCNATRLEVGE